MNQHSKRLSEKNRTSADTEKLVDLFCTPPPAHEKQTRFLSPDHAEIREIPFEGYPLVSYAWGSGNPVLLVHGWGSRAGHMAALARMLLRSGFRVVAFDGPAHGRSMQTVHKPRSSMFAFCRAIHEMDRHFGPFHGIAGHSMGAAAAVFTAAGHKLLSNFRVNTRKLALISCPANVARMAERFCRNAGLNPEQEKRLMAGLENAFHFSAADYQVNDVLKNVNTRVLVVHDANDEEIPLSDGQLLKAARKDIALIVTHGSGHIKILASKSMIEPVVRFFSENNFHR